MGVKVYYIVVAAVILLGLLMPQQGGKRKNYIILMALLHTFVCGWRYMYMHGDLQKYAWGYYTITDKGWFSEEVFQEGRNTGFFWLQKLLSTWTNGDFQIFLIVIAIVIEIAVAIVIYRYSPKPWVSYLMWNCIGFYVFGFSAIKQALAMGFLMLAFIGIMENKPKKFLAWTFIAGFIHLPALIFLPAYWIVKTRITPRTIFVYLVAVSVIYLFRTQIVTFISEFYYDETDYTYGNQLGGRFFMICLLLIAGVILKGFYGRQFSKVFSLIAVAAILQMFSGFDNVFTRLTDYYLQFLILYVPMLFADFEPEGESGAKFRLSQKQRPLLLICVVLFSIWFYKSSCLAGSDKSVDDITNYRFCWEVLDTE